MALTVAWFRYLTHLHQGRVRAFHAGLRLRTTAPSNFDVAQALRQAIDEDRIGALVIAAEPSLAVYQRLKMTLARHRQLAAGDLPRAPPLPPHTKKIEPGARYAGVAALAERLRRLDADEWHVVLLAILLDLGHVVVAGLGKPISFQPMKSRFPP